MDKIIERVQDSGNYSYRRRPLKIAILGSMPPLRALSSYCFELTSAVISLGKVEFISFRSIYPTLIYPGGRPGEDHTFPYIGHPNLKVRRRLTWYNPFTWINEGLSTDAELLHAQWWSLPLVFIYFTVCLGFRLRRRPVIFTILTITLSPAIVNKSRYYPKNLNKNKHFLTLNYCSCGFRPYTFL